jgi:hypothetical protein
MKQIIQDRIYIYIAMYIEEFVHTKQIHLLSTWYLQPIFINVILVNHAINVFS